MSEGGVERVVAARQAHREESLRLQAEHERYQQEMRARLTQEARVQAEEEQHRMQQQLADAREQEKLLLRRAGAGDAQGEREQLRREQKHFMQMEAQRISREQSALVSAEERRLRAEQQAEQDRLLMAEAQLRPRSAAAGSAASSRGVAGASAVAARSAEMHESSHAAAERAASRASTAAAGKRRKLLIMTVDIGDGRVETIEVFEGDAVDDLARQFCAKHALGDAIVPHLAQQITTNLQALPKQQQQQQRGGAGSSRTRPQSARASQNRSSSAASGGNNLSGMEPLSPRSPANRSRQADSARRMSIGVAQMHEDAHRRRRLEREREGAGTPRIDKNSERIAGGRPPGAVFDRLYQHNAIRLKSIDEQRAHLLETEQQAIESTRLPLTSAARQRGTSASFRNPGERLYSQGLENQQRKASEAQKMREEAEKDDELTFAPKITKHAAASRSSSVNAWERMSAEADRIRQQRELKAQEAAKAELDGCTFHPAVSGTSEEIAKRRLSSHNMGAAVDRLYTDAERRRVRQEEFRKWQREATHKPQINEHSEALASSTVAASGVPVEDRLLQSAVELQKKLEKLRAEREQHGRDIVTNDPLHRPNASRASASRGSTSGSASARDFDGRTIFERLFAEKLGVSGDDRMHAAAEDLSAVRAQGLNLSHATEEAVRNGRRKRLAKLATNWADADGLLHAHAIDLADIPVYAGRDLLMEVKSSLSEPITVDEFVDRVEQVVPRFAGPRSTLFILPNYGKYDEELTFRPVVSGDSAEMAKKRRDANKPIYEVLDSERVLRLQRLREFEEQKRAAELRDCTFQPSTSHPSVMGPLRRDQADALARRLTPHHPQDGDGSRQLRASMGSFGDMP